MSAVDPLSDPTSTRTLNENDLLPDPLAQFERWFGEAVEAKLAQPEAMALATCPRGGAPSVRMVLLRKMDQRGFVFFTNYTSRKARELLENPQVALLFFWEPLERQVRIEGTVAMATAEESDAYYDSRPRGSRLGAWASPQSAVIADRAELEQRLAEIEQRYGQEGPVPRPPFWGGFRVTPAVVEFWQGRPSRLHDRLRYRRADEGWLIERLAP